MQGSGFGDIFHISTFGESHGKAVGVIIDGVPAGIPLSEEDVQLQLDRRRPGQGIYTTQRNEEDLVEIFSGVFEGMTTGTPIMMMVRNKDQRSKDYSDIAEVFRPGHGDFSYDSKYGFRDYRGGGRASARETIGRVCAGAVALKALRLLGIDFLTYTESIGPVVSNDFDFGFMVENELHIPDREAFQRAKEYLDELRANNDSAGGCACCLIGGVMPGLGEPVFGKLDALLSQAMMSIGAVKAVEIGDGIKASIAKGSENNDPFIIRDGKIKKATNHAGGILGGISDGSNISMRIHFKPTPSIAMEQDTVDKDGNERKLVVKGRHDPIVVPRALVVVESMAAIVIFDAVLKNMTSRMDNIMKFYGGKS